MTKKEEKMSSEILGVKMGIFSEKTVIQKSWSEKKFSFPPKLGARSPPLRMSAQRRLTWHQQRRSHACY